MSPGTCFLFDLKAEDLGRGYFAGGSVKEVLRKERCV